MANKILILTFIIIIALIGFGIYSGYFGVSSYSDKEKEILQKTLYEYDDCIENNDVGCACKYLIELHCNSLSKGGLNEHKRSLELSREFLRLTEKISDSMVEGDPYVNAGNPTRSVTYRLNNPSKNPETPHSLRFVYVNDQWKVLDFD